jgi:hypothetical protein
VTGQGCPVYGFSFVVVRPLMKSVLKINRKAREERKEKEKKAAKALFGLGF